MAAAARRSPDRFDFVVIGGGVAGVSCAQELERASPKGSILLITRDAALQVASKVTKLTENLAQFEPKSLDIKRSGTVFKRVTVREASVRAVVPKSKTIVLESGAQLRYGRLCVCSGARPALVHTGCSRVLGVRDAMSIKRLGKRLVSARRVVVVGNGGIALELVHAIHKAQSKQAFKASSLGDLEVAWVIRDRHLGHAFLDRTAGAFLLPFLFPERDPDGGGTADFKNTSQHVPQKRARASSQPQNPASTASTAQADQPNPGLDGSLGPFWLSCLEGMFDPAAHSIRSGRVVRGQTTESETETPIAQPRVNMHFKAEITGIDERNTAKTAKSFPLLVQLSTGKSIECDFVVSATGVQPQVSFLDSEFKRGPEGGVAVDDAMRTSVSDVYAAGDACDCVFKEPSFTWFQMRLWTQARVMGLFAARSMLDQADQVGFNFEIFAHTTSFFGLKVVLLGLFDARGLGEEEKDFKILIRCKPGEEFVRVVLRNHRVVGATLIGETDLEETFENLILNQIHLGRIEDELLREDVDLEDYFD